MVLFSRPGAVTATCSTCHLPGFENNADPYGEFSPETLPGHLTKKAA